MENDRDQPDGPPPEPDRSEPVAPRDGVEGVSEEEAPSGSGAEPAVPPGTHTALPPKVEAWRKRSAVGAILTGFALGLQEALEKRKEEPGIVMETSGDPPRDLPVEAEFEYGRPRQSVVQIRPWLLPDAGSRTGESPDAEKKTPSADGSPPDGSADQDPA